MSYLLTDNSPQYKQPKGIKIQLKPHQLASLYKLVALDKESGLTSEHIRSNIGILGDRAGYGKTITFLALIESLKNAEVKWMPNIKVNISKSYGIFSTIDRELPHIKTSLIVVPDNLIIHWRKHLINYTDLSFEIVTDKNIDKLFVEGYDVLLCKASIYNRFISNFNEYIWNRVAFDEADSINIPNTAYVKTRYLWLITATFENMVRRHNKGFLTNLLDFYDMEQFGRDYGHIIVKGADSFVMKSFNLIEPQVTFIDCITPPFIRAIRNHIDNSVLELINAGDIDNAIIRLGGSVTNDRNIMDLVARNINNELIYLEMKKSATQQLNILPEEKSEKLSKLEEKIKSLKSRQESLGEAIKTISNNNCCICLDLLQYPTLVPCCNNMFCAKCIINWLQNNSTCPLCRGNFHTSQLIYLKQGHHVEPIKANDCVLTKYNTVLKLLKNNPTGKFLVFSGYFNSFRDIANILKHAGIEYGILSTHNTTHNTLNKFKNNDIRVILLDAQHNGAGIEIPEATDIIILHELPPSLELQCIARAQRPNRIGQLNVWKLKYHHEYCNRVTGS